MANALELRNVIGIDGSASNTLLWHPDGKQIIHGLGSLVVLRDLSEASKQTFLQGHDGPISALALSRSGRFLASGQLSNMGFPAPICVWDMHNGGALHHRLLLQRVKIQALGFSPDETRLASLGGHDDNSLVLWDVATGNPICGAPTHNDFTLCLAFFNHNNDALVTAGKCNLHVWEYNAATNKLRMHEVETGKLERHYLSLSVDAADQFAFVGTHSGDILQIGLSTRLFRNYGPKQGPIVGGITANCEAPTGDLLVGGGDGTIAVMRVPPESTNAKLLQKMPLLATAKLQGAITSITMDPASLSADPRTLKHYAAVVCTDRSVVYHVSVDVAKLLLTTAMISTAHASPVLQVAFPRALSEVFATCSYEQIRVWHLPSCRELLRIQLPNITCHCVAFNAAGSEIISGWSDGKVRAFGPQSGKLLYTIHNAHHKAVTAIAGSPDSELVISGGAEGYVRAWLAADGQRKMVAAMKEHKDAVHSIAVSTSGAECVSASKDGSCVVWDLTTFRRRASLFANCFFMRAVYHPDESQLVTVASDRKLSIWDAYDCSAIRVLDASESHAATALDVSERGTVIVTGSADNEVKVWGYDEGCCYLVGVGHSDTVKSVAIAPDEQHIVSTGADGAILIWRLSPTMVADATASFEAAMAEMNGLHVA